jgi:hypothetical protein
VQTVYCRFPEAEATYQSAVSLVEKLKAEGEVSNLAGLYTEFSVLYFFRSQYNEVSDPIYHIHLCYYQKYVGKFKWMVDLLYFPNFFSFLHYLDLALVWTVNCTHVTAAMCRGQTC